MIEGLFIRTDFTKYALVFLNSGFALITWIHAKNFADRMSSDSNSVSALRTSRLFGGQLKSTTIADLQPALFKSTVENGFLYISLISSEQFVDLLGGPWGSVVRKSWSRLPRGQGLALS